MVHVEITNKHITAGHKKSFTLDAFALAVKDAIKEKFDIPIGKFHVIAVDASWLYIEGYIIELPKVAERFIFNSDRRLPLEPCTFELDIPDDLFNEREHTKYE